MKKLLVIFLTALLSVTSINAQNASDIMERFFSKLDKQTLSLKFSATTTDLKGGNPMTYNGFIELRGEVFHARVWEVEIAYDGKTLYSYNEEVNELTLSYPTQDELQQGNPILLAKAMSELCDARLVAQQPQGMTIVELMPRTAGAGFSRLTIYFEKSTLLPQKILLREDNSTTTLVLQERQWSDKLPDTDIPADKESKPFINDLR